MKRLGRVSFKEPGAFWSFMRALREMKGLAAVAHPGKLAVILYEEVNT